MKPTKIKNAVNKNLAVNKILVPDQQSTKNDIKESNFK